MKLTVSVRLIRELSVDIEAENFQEATNILKNMTNDDFQETGCSYQVSIFDEKLNDVTGQIQPSMPMIDPS